MLSEAQQPVRSAAGRWWAAAWSVFAEVHRGLSAARRPEEPARPGDRTVTRP